MNGPFRLDATGWSPVGTLVGGEPGVVDKPRRGPSIAFAVSVIALVAVATAGTVHFFFSSETDAAVAEDPGVPVHSVVSVRRPVVTASLGDMLPADSGSDGLQAPVADRFAADEVQEALADIDAPDPQDPRWARAADDLVPPPAVAASDAAVVPSADAAPDQPQQTGHTDVTETAAIAPEEASPPSAAKPELPAVENPAVADDPMSLVTRARPAQVSRAVNMRARPKSGSQKLMVIPRGASVQLVGCKLWCEIVYKGRHGYVYKDYLGGARSAVAAGKPKATKTAQAKAAKTAQAKPANSGQADQPGLPGVDVPMIKPLSSRLQ